MISGIDVSYKTIERLYSDNEVILAIHNLHVLILKKNDINNSNATGDGTGYGLTVKKNYESYAQKLKDLAKESPEKRENKGKIEKAKEHKKRLFAYSFNITDLETRLYIVMGASMKSERQAYDRAIKLLGSIHVEMDSIRLDRYYSFPSYMDSLGITKVYIMPKKNSTLNGSKKWKDTMKEFVENTIPYLGGITRGAIQNPDLRQTRRCLGGMWHRKGMTEYTVHYSGQAHGIICSIWADYRIVSHTP
jgi:transposase